MGGWEGWSGWVMVIGMGMCCGECCVLCKTGESQTCTPKISNTSYDNNNSKEDSSPLMGLH